MAEFLVRNSLNPNIVVKFGITLQKTVTSEKDGVSRWLFCIGTKEKDLNGNTISPEYIALTDLDNLDEEIEKAVSKISSKIDWSPLLDDSRGPIIENFSPDTYEVSINSIISFDLRDKLPSSGIDLNTLSVKINGVEVKDELQIEGNPYDYHIVWVPKKSYK